MYSILQELSTLGSSAAAGAGNKTAFVFYMGNRLKFTVVLVAGYFLLQQLKGAFAAFCQRVVDSCEADTAQMRGEDVIEAAKADIIGNP